MRYRSLAEFHWHGTSFSELTNLLPFDRERAEEINEKSDVVRFCSPFSRTLVLLLADGTQVSPGMGKSEEGIAGMFRNYAEINLGDFCQKCRKQFFDQEVYAKIGKAMKYPFALLMLQRSLRFEDEVNVNWVPTYDEAVEDLECAFFLSANCFYKQGLGILRNAIELSVAHAYFHLDEDAFGQWGNDPDHRLPYVRGNGGMLCKLRQADWIDDRIYETGYDLYGRLNSCVHATRERMGSRRGEMDVEKLAEFCTVSSEVGEFVINLTLHLIVNWNSQPIDAEGITDIRF